MHPVVGGDEVAHACVVSDRAHTGCVTAHPLVAADPRENTGRAEQTEHRRRDADADPDGDEPESDDSGEIPAEQAGQ